MKDIEAVAARANRSPMEEQTYQQTYPNRDDPTRIPVVVIVGDHVPDEYAEELASRQWTAEGDKRPVIMLRESEAKRLAAEMFAAIYRLERARNA